MTVNAKFFAATFVLLVSGCSCEKELRELTETELTSEGGIARSFDGLLELRIPRGGLDTHAVITIETLRDLRPQGLLSATYALRSSGGALKLPADLQIRITASGEAKLARVEGERPIIVENSSHDAIARIVSAQISTMAIYCVVPAPILLPDAGIEAPDAGEPDADEADADQADADEPDADEPDAALADAEAGANVPSDAEVDDAGEPGDGGAPEDGGTSSTGDAAVAVNGIDLYLDCRTPPVGPWQVGSSHPVSFDVGNSGNQDSGPFRVLVLLSEDQLISPIDIALLTIPGEVPASSMATVSGTVTVPVSVMPGSYFVGVIIDYEEVVMEVVEHNNIEMLGPVQIIP